MKLREQIKHHLHSGWVIANHILVSFHIAFISSLLSIPPALFGTKVLKFVFFSHDTIISTIFWFISFHTGVAIHEMGHYLRAVKINALKENLLPEAKKKMTAPLFVRIVWIIKMYLTIPYGKFSGVKKEGLTYYPEAPFNLSVAAAGPLISRKLATVMLPIAFFLLTIGLTSHLSILVYLGRLSLGIGTVGLLDFFLADPGKYREYIKREREAKKKAQKIEVKEEGWIDRMKQVKETMIKKRMQEITLPNGEKLRAPWQFRNCGMGGRHTEKEYPESNISMQEMMFLPICARNYEEAQMITVSLQTRLKQIIEKAEGARVMGIGLEGGLAPYIAKETQDRIPEQRMWRMAVQAIKDIGYTPGKDVVIGLDPALSELSNAYREEFKQKDSIGMYYFWRGEEKVVMSRDELVELYKKAVKEIPIVSLEDPFGEDDEEGWRLLMAELSDKIFIIGDDNITTKDSAIEESADKKLINTALIKANQIGTLSETILAVLVALGKGLDIVVSHRSKSPNDDMEAQIALSANALGLKAGGGANTERLFKYGAVTKIMKDMEKVIAGKFEKADLTHTKTLLNNLVITDIIAYEEPTNAGIPTVGIEVYAGIPGSKEYRKLLRFSGSTPLGTSAGTGEAIHLIDSIIEASSITKTYPDLFTAQPDKTYRFKKGITEKEIKEKNDPQLNELWNKVQRYDGKGCQNAIQNVLKIIAPRFIGKKVIEFKNISDIDQRLLSLERETAIQRGKITQHADMEKMIDIMQRKGNLGMNAILAVSLAMARLIAHIQGKDLWQLLRDEMKTIIARLIVAENGKGSEQELKQLTFEKLIAEFRMTADKLKKEEKKLYVALRGQTPIYSKKDK